MHAHGITHLYTLLLQPLLEFSSLHISSSLPLRSKRMFLLQIWWRISSIFSKSNPTREGLGPSLQKTFFLAHHHNSLSPYSKQWTKQRIPIASLISFTFSIMFICCPPFQALGLFYMNQKAYWGRRGRVLQNLLSDAAMINDNLNPPPPFQNKLWSSISLQHLNCVG